MPTEIQQKPHIKLKHIWYPQLKKQKEAAKMNFQIYFIHTNRSKILSFQHVLNIKIKGIF